MTLSVVNFVYLVAAVLFIVGLKGLSHPRTAVRGNLLGALGMFLAVVATLFDKAIVSFEVITAGLIAGTVAGAFLAIRIRMTAMPQMVALFNGLGGGASTLVAGAVLIESAAANVSLSPNFTISTALSGLIGTVTFWGSLVAFGKLEGIIPERPVSFRGHHAVKIILLLLCIACGALIVRDPALPWPYWALTGFSTILGILLVTPIGGADMPVVISLLNSYSGLAAAATGFVLSNNVLIIAGSLVGASGIILSDIMCRAMNRSLANVLFGGMGAHSAPAAAGDIYEGKVKSATAEDVAMLLDGARRVVFVPGYGLAVSQAQHAVRDLANLLGAAGTEVEFAIHPVAGRMPGHMNVLLAEASIPYEKLKEMDEINPSFETTDVAIVIGANDVVNPSARTDPGSPIAGMPILDVDKSHTVVVIKRSLAPGFAGIPNPLFAADNTLMVFGDAKKVVLELVASFKEISSAR